MVPCSALETGSSILLGFFLFEGLGFFLLDIPRRRGVEILSVVLGFDLFLVPL